MQELVKAVQANWQGYEDLRVVILKRGDFFGNDTDRSNYVAQKLYASMYEFLKNKKNLFGYHLLMGDLIGYQPHHKLFGEKTKATPDGRHDGDYPLGGGRAGARPSPQGGWARKLQD